MENMKINNNGMYGKNAGENIYLDTDNDIINFDISYDELVLAQRIGDILDINTGKVVGTAHVKLMRMLVEKIESLELINETHREMVDGVKNLIKDLEG